MNPSIVAKAYRKSAFYFAVIGLIAVLQVGSCEANAAAEDYLVVSLVEKGNAYDEASVVLARRHSCRAIRGSVDQIEKLLPQFQSRQPSHVAFIVDPSDLDVNLAGKILQVATKVDDDPFVDFAYGFITGRTAESSLKLVRASEPKTERKPPKIVQFGVGGKMLPKSMKQASVLPVGNGSIPMTVFLSKGETDEDADRPFIRESLGSLKRSPVLLLASHGYPDGLVGGLKAADVDRLDQNGTIAVNIACYNGVTDRWFEDNWKSGKVSERRVAGGESMCLSMIDAGVAGYFASTCPRPAGPIPFGHSISICTQGLSLGEIMRRDLNRVVLAHLLNSHDSIQVKPYSDGEVLAVGRTPGAVVERMSVGGILVGDPAFVPFDRQEELEPIRTDVKLLDDRIVADVKIRTPAFHFFAAEQINYWKDKSPALRLEATFEIERRQPTSVLLSRSPLPDMEHRLIAAIEKYRGKRYLHAKAVFQQPEGNALQSLAMKGFGGQFVVTTDDEVRGLMQGAQVFRGDVSP
ncbi:hypothetical protein U8335_09020 [Roseiconus lacunae]|uniref:hypothetical protein n=1 Tax=Roseiconus lacunae TaxID=2605694 RepID=UPI00308F1502|nr:hypothetical protein U8335_09020 [Stieleria sp. HD01]